jgi:hypothetical protein
MRRPVRRCWYRSRRWRSASAESPPPRPPAKRGSRSRWGEETGALPEDQVRGARRPKTRRRSRRLVTGRRRSRRASPQPNDGRRIRLPRPPRAARGGRGGRTRPRWVQRARPCGRATRRHAPPGVTVQDRIAVTEERHGPAPRANRSWGRSDGRLTRPRGLCREAGVTGVLTLLQARRKRGGFLEAAP